MLQRRRLPLSSLSTIMIFAAVAGCKARTEASRAMATKDAPTQAAAFHSGLPEICRDWVRLNEDPFKVCTKTYCEFLATEEPLPFYKVLDTGGLLNDAPGRGRLIKDVEAVISTLRRGSVKLEKLYACDSGVWERALDPEADARVRAELAAAWPGGEWQPGQQGKQGLPFTIGFHTRRVLQVFNDQRKYYDVPNTTLGGYRYQSYPMMVWVTAFHDVGKAVAGELHDTSLQHDFIPQLARVALRRMGFPPYEVDLAVSLVEHDLVGEYMKAALPARERAKEELIHGMRERARAADIPVKDFWSMQKLFYISDSTSYAAVRRRFFAKLVDGAKVPFTDSDVALGSGDAWYSAELKPAGAPLVSADGRLEEISALLGR